MMQQQRDSQKQAFSVAVRRLSASVVSVVPSLVLSLLLLLLVLRHFALVVAFGLLMLSLYLLSPFVLLLGRQRILPLSVVVVRLPARTSLAGP